MILLNLLLTGSSPSQENNAEEEPSSDEELASAVLPGLAGTFPCTLLYY